MKKSGILFMGCILPFSLLAQEVIEIDKEDLVVAEEKGTVAKAISSADPRVVILNNHNQKVNQQAVHDQKARSMSHQPVVRVLGTPISTTYAVELKKSRQEAELQTEQKIVEKLESSRLRDEQERLNRLFSGKSHPLIAEAKTVVDSPKTVDSSEIYTEVVKPVQKSTGEDSIYMGVSAGQASNLTKALSNVNSYGSFGLSFGSYDDSGLILESGFYYSKHEINKKYKNLYKNNQHNYGESRLTDVHQLTGLLSVSYTPSSGRFKPYFGPAVSYNYWIYSADTGSTGVCRGINFKYCDNQVKADSIDLSLNIGMDFKLSSRFSVGFKMLVNVWNIYNNRPDQKKTHNYHNHYHNHHHHYTYIHSNRKYYNPLKLEETNHIIASINAKLYF